MAVRLTSATLELLELKRRSPVARGASRVDASTCRGLEGAARADTAEVGAVHVKRSARARNTPETVAYYDEQPAAEAAAAEQLIMQASR